MSSWRRKLNKGLEDRGSALRPVQSIQDPLLVRYLAQFRHEVAALVQGKNQEPGSVGALLCELSRKIVLRLMADSTSPNSRLQEAATLFRHAASLICAGEDAELVLYAKNIRARAEDLDEALRSPQHKQAPPGELPRL